MKHTHLINENPHGSALWAARYFLYFNSNRQASVEWYLLHHAHSSFALKIEFGHGDGDDGIMFHAAIPWLFSVFISIDSIFGKTFHYPNESRETGISFHDGTFYFYPFAKVMSWSTKDSWYSKYHAFNLYETAFGRDKYSEEQITPWEPIVVAMPEGKYGGKLRLFTSVWKNRIRTKRIRRADIEMETGVPFPGKGENSWDCGEDCTYGLTCPANEPEEAIASLIKSVLRNRRVYGCRGCLNDYTPEKIYTRCLTPKSPSECSEQ
jgi:hypothetical protein